MGSRSTSAGRTTVSTVSDLVREHDTLGIPHFRRSLVNKARG